MEAPLLKPDFLFEVGWEVCNKVGGIHTVMSTKATSLLKQMSSNYILIGPDVWRDEIDNPEFMEDKMLFKAWRERSFEEGLRIRIGRWNIPGNPIAVIVDFTTFIAIKDEVLKDFWENYKLDSISGQWDYVEPVLFGYAAGKVVESFVRFNTSSRENVIAHFHEWMTGSGILYLDKYLPGWQQFLQLMLP
jgi:glycogen phosphorylase/synthase